MYENLPIILYDCPYLQNIKVQRQNNMYNKNTLIPNFLFCFFRPNIWMEYIGNTWKLALEGFEDISILEFVLIQN